MLRRKIPPLLRLEVPLEPFPKREMTQVRSQRLQSVFDLRWAAGRRNQWHLECFAPISQIGLASYPRGSVPSSCRSRRDNAETKPGTRAQRSISRSRENRRSYLFLLSRAAPTRRDVALHRG